MQCIRRDGQCRGLVRLGGGLACTVRTYTTGNTNIRCSHITPGSSHQELYAINIINLDRCGRLADVSLTCYLACRHVFPFVPGWSFICSSIRHKKHFSSERHPNEIPHKHLGKVTNFMRVSFAPRNDKQNTKVAL